MAAALAPAASAQAHSNEMGVPATAPRTSAHAAPAAPPANSAVASAYDRIDQGTAPVLLHSGAQQVAVGLRDPDLGWIEIKTQNMAGHVDATLVTSSGNIHDSLAAQLPAMAAYLEQRDVRVGTLAVHHEAPIANPGSGLGNGTGGYGSGNSGAGAQHSGQSGSGGQGGRYTGAPPEVPALASKTREVEQAGPSFRPVSYISVRA